MAGVLFPHENEPTEQYSAYYTLNESLCKAELGDVRYVYYCYIC